MTRQPRHRNLADAARGYNAPPAAPRERMWERIDSARRATRPMPLPIAWWRRRRVLWPVAVAASLTMGLLIGRGLPGAGPVAAPSVAVQDHDITAGPLQPSGDSASHGGSAYSLAARPVLARSESLFLQVRTEQVQDPQAYGDRARDLLALTRLLLDSPARQDAELAPLLTDLELALARLVQLAHGTPAAGDTDHELKALREGLTHQSVMPRLRNQLAAGQQPVGL